MEVNYTAVNPDSLIRRKPKIVNAVLLGSNIPGCVHLSSNLCYIFAGESKPQPQTDEVRLLWLGSVGE